MMWEIAVIGVLVVIICLSRGMIDGNKFVQDNSALFKLLKESDYDFLVKAKYGDEVDSDVLFEKRIQNGLLVLVILVVVFISSLNFINLLACFAGAYFVFKSGYSNVKSYYKKHLHEIDLLLPYYLKSLEILIQHYTVPVAIGKSIGDAPDIFRPGLRRMIDRINAGDATVDPYMEFANTYPVRDSMRMMRLLYRLGIGSQEKKQERLMMFSRSISALQNKARETKYKERLNHMESRTMLMLIVTGVSVMGLILITMMMMFSV